MRTLRQIELIGGLLLIFLLLFSCAAAPPRASTRAEVLDDATIQANVKSELVDDPRIDADAVTLEVRRGVVTLVGWVDSDNQRKNVEDLTWSVPGVRDVDNRLQLR
ncbi:MAG TPA: BON domain-containing protein [Candidatus Polarisedimenticolaceae bacterium]|nr:BON domain-containing protein [Candidatus Polarisedimenticolaceae bacterium]